MLYPHKIKFEPLCLIDQTIVPIEPGVPKPAWKAYKVVWIEPLPEIIKDFGSLTATAPGNIKAIQEFKELTLPDNELGQWRIAPFYDDIKVSFNQPKTVGRFVTVEVMCKVGLEIWKINPTLSRTELYTLGKGFPYLTIENATKYNLPMSRVIAQGFRFQLEPLPALPAQYTVVPIVGKPAKG